MKHNTKKTTRIHDTQKRHTDVTAPAPPTCTKHQKRYTCICRNIYQHFQFFQQQAQKRYVCCRHCLQDLPILQLVGKKTYVHEQINFQNLAPFYVCPKKQYTQQWMCTDMFTSGAPHYSAKIAHLSLQHLHAIMSGTFHFWIFCTAEKLACLTHSYIFTGSVE